MTTTRLLYVGIVVTLFLPTGAHAQTTAQGLEPAVPRTIPLTGTLVDATGQALTGPVRATFGIYATAEGGEPLWSEAQVVTLDERGRFSVWLGGTADGVPVGLFQTGEARWLGIQGEGMPDQPRVRLLSVPYALKASDAETLGGLPASAFLRAEAGTDGRTGLRVAGDAGRTAVATTGADATFPTAYGVEQSASPYATAYGYQALNSNTATGTANAAFGYQALTANTTGQANSVFGYQAMMANMTGSWNTAVGSLALLANTTGEDNTAVGRRALEFNTTGNHNTAVGYSALRSNTVGSDNVALGYNALFSGALNRNVGLGYRAGFSATGSNNVYIANEGVAGESGAIYLGTEGTHTKTALVGNVGIGTTAPTQKLHVAGTSSTYVNVASSGGNAGLVLSSSGSSAHLWSKSADGAFVVENPLGTARMVVTADGKLGVGTTTPAQAFELLGGGSQYVNLWSTAGNAGFVLTAGGYQGIVRENVADGSLALENPNGTERMRIASNGYVGIGTAAPAYPLHLASGAHVTTGGVWTNASSRALKDRIAALMPDDALAALAALQPVTYIYKADPTDPQVGFIAEDVPDLVATNDRGSLSPMDIVAVAVKVIQEQQRQIEGQAAEIQALRARLAVVEQRLAGSGPR